MSPESDRRFLHELLSSLKKSAKSSINSEIKLSALDESLYLSFLESLGKLNGVLFAVANDAGLNNPREIAEHQRTQAAKVIEHKDKLLHQAARDGLQDLSNRIGALAPQLYVQLQCQINLIEMTIRNGVLYFVQRYPRHLGNFRWRIDQKNSTKTQYETAFTHITPALLQSISLQTPMLMLEGENYSMFNRFEYLENEKPTYLRDVYGIETRRESPINIGMLIRENLEFVDSRENHGVQVADLLASGLRRCLRKRFFDNQAAAHLLGKLMVQNYKGISPVQLIGFSRETSPVMDDVGNLIKIMAANSRAMLTQKP